jgi:pRiA4b ORF-3-like protein
MTRGYQRSNAVQLRVWIDRIEPQIWRRLVVPSSFTLRDLHLVLQAAFGWTHAHLHEFEIGGLRFGDADIANAENGPEDARALDEMEVRLRDFTREPGTEFRYIYDMGDNWVHAVCLEKHVAIDPAPKMARCIDGARARPPEDVGGPSGYQNFLEAVLDPTHDEHKQIKRWAGGHFDPEWFDLELINGDLAHAFRVNLKRRVHQPKPSTVAERGK